jgi:hypothetical protein
MYSTVIFSKTLSLVSITAIIMYTTFILCMRQMCCVAVEEFYALSVAMVYGQEVDNVYYYTDAVI